MPFVEDTSVFLNTSEFATEATLNGVAVRGIFDNGYADRDNINYEFEELGRGVSASAPLFTLPSVSVPSPVIGLALVIGSTTYKVAEPMPDGTGFTTLRLRT